MIDIPRETAYYRLNYSKTKDKQLIDLEIKDEIEKIQLDFPYSRKIKGWALSRNIDANLTITALNQALKNNPKPDIHHSDQGVQYCAKEYIEILKEKEIQISMSDKANPF